MAGICMVRTFLTLCISPGVRVCLLKCRHHKQAQQNGTIHTVLTSQAADLGVVCQQVGMNYHVRVLIPCYREPLSIVSRTITAAHEAVLPAGCQRNVYVCDDGKDPKIKKFCRSLGLGVTYVSGRRREAGEMNGKSGNLNNCLSQIYPEDLPVPPHELVAIFDADQVWTIPSCMLCSAFQPLASHFCAQLCGLSQHWTDTPVACCTM